MQAILMFLDQYWVFIVIATLGSAWFVYPRWKTREKIKALAKEMGIFYSTGADELLGLLRQNQGAPMENQNASRLADLLGVFAGWRLAGKMNGVPISVFEVAESTTSSDETKRRYTLLRAKFEPPLDLGLFVARRQTSSLPGVVQKIADKLLPRSEDRTEVLSNNDVLDKKVVIKARSPEAVRNLLDDAAVQDQILRTMELEGGVTIDDHGVSVSTGGNIKDPERIRSILNVTSATAALLQAPIK